VRCHDYIGIRRIGRSPDTTFSFSSHARGSGSMTTGHHCHHRRHCHHYHYYHNNNNHNNDNNNNNNNNNDSNNTGCAADSRLSLST
jgi:hypothetical protein